MEPERAVCFLDVFLQVQHPVFDFLGSALVPELGTDVAAGAPGHVHFALVPVAALGADPNQLVVIFPDLNFSVVAADLMLS